ncbi:hypothetical protein JX265_012240 [Neoarthrinium moseri]|uniref:SET domain-containing protein n=1 Tax=Neoarthrinium moseri TaxID=1658444 RepID=A0A9P9WB21_9PEZI|nr:hypothetical protein JX265_012240 [Neoarthrinium moseri]
MFRELCSNSFGAHTEHAAAKFCIIKHAIPLGLGVCPIPVDDATSKRTGNHSPWAYPPRCVKPANRPKKGPKYCVYNFEDFRGGEGLSIIATPEIAVEVIDALDDATVSPKLRSHPSSLLFPGAERVAPFEIEDVPNKGKGVIATEDFKQWQTVMVDFPAVIAPMDLFEAVSPEQGRHLIQNAIERLPVAKKAAILSLAAGSEGGMVQGILNTNSFGINFEQNQYIALFPTGSRVNHDCRANVFWRYSHASMTMEFVALQDISAGDEIAYGYIPLGGIREERQELLRQWGFNCSCSLCLAPASEVAKSDAARTRIQTIADRLRSAKANKKGKLTRLVSEMLHLVDQEGLGPQLVVWYDLISRAYLQVDDFENAELYADLADQTWKQHGGEFHEGVDDIRALREALQARRTESIGPGIKMKN